MFELLLPELIQWLQKKLQHFKSVCVCTRLKEWVKITSDPEVLQAKKGLTLDFLEELSINKVGMNSGQNSPQIMSEVNKLLKKGIVINTTHEEGDFISPIFLRSNPDETN